MTTAKKHTCCYRACSDDAAIRLFSADQADYLCRPHFYIRYRQLSKAYKRQASWVKVNQHDN